MNEVLFIRHGATAGNLQRRYIGRTDEPLSEIGVQQARALAAKNLRADRVFISPAMRTQQTAKLAFPDQPLISAPDLWETDFGIFEGKSADEMAEDLQYRSWVDAGCVGPVPNGESTDGFKKRVCAAFLRCMETTMENECTAFVIHGGCIMSILEAFARPELDFYQYHIPNGAILRSRYRDKTLTLL